MQRALLDRPPYYDHDYDGRPRTDWNGYDPLLDALIREHPEMIPPQLVAKLAKPRCNLLAAAEWRRRPPVHRSGRR